MIKENNTAKDTLISESKSDNNESLKANPAKHDVEAILDFIIIFFTFDADQYSKPKKG